MEVVAAGMKGQRPHNQAAPAGIRLVRDHFNAAGGADIGAGAAADTDIGASLERRCHLALGAAVGQADGADPDHLLAEADAEAAEDALLITLLFEAGRFNTHLPGHCLQYVHIRSAGQQQFDKHAPDLPDLGGIGKDLHAFIVYRGIT